MQNTSDSEYLVFVEVQIGKILQEEDIRYEDDYSPLPRKKKTVIVCNMSSRRWQRRHSFHTFPTIVCA